MATKRDSEPYTMEITKQLDLSTADEKAIARFRDNPFADEDQIIAMAVGSHVTARERIIIYWLRWRQFVQSLYREGSAESPVRTEEVTRRYRIMPE
jgi:hypothetical protein